MGVSLFHSSAGTVFLPWPAHEQPVEVVRNQLEQRAASGALRTVNQGPVRYRIQRTFEALTDEDQSDLAEWLRDVNFAASDVDYQYQPHGVDESRTVTCRIVDEIEAVRVHRDMWDVTLTFEQSVNPNRLDDPTLAAPSELTATPNPD